ncbi:hypothetical protein ACR8AL_07655 [Clavibacter sepedonicus]|uniref:Exported protein n=1 Tax=Clavibacter sepedonicus TaxID=31964 RepID=B0RCS9_CLASE|nr:MULTISPECIES: hypothetical protein [Clavibacter]MBD5381026.1 hypothetical protein [Clavibacter sp.]OQJ47509.1 hypothetical protein B5P19_03880 [Clavibacter sepedonicus]OQJ53065.1 hypothetical protein B5P20_02140 [Clavibacter sepedonicus]UUK64215.1 hypothetical protein LRE50_07795 [Clavibacter sepedonicus]CAQ01850.1 putative exported protein [Clavibacter sepedonicus]
MNRPLTSLALVGALLVGGALAAAPANAVGDDGTVVYYSLPFRSDLVRVEQPSDQPQALITTATYAQWQADGFPAPAAAGVTYHAYTWSPDVLADLTFGTDDRAEATRLSFAEWQRVGSPRPVTTSLPEVGYAFSYGSSSEVFVDTFLLFLHGGTPLTAPTHKLTYAEYVHLGSAELAYNVADNYPFSGMFMRKLAWSPAIVWEIPQNGSGDLLSYDDWAARAFPTPQVVKSFPGDRYCQAAGSSDITYRGYAAPGGVKMSYSQWAAAGRPAPARC